jgi:DNA processing protein
VSEVDTAWIALSLLKHVGSKTIRALLAHFDGDLSTVLAANTKQLCEVPGVGAKIAASIQTIELKQTEAAIHRWQSAGVTILTLNDPTYPRYLAQLDDAPAALFLRGAWLFPEHFRAVALVGTRTPTLQSRIAANRLAAYWIERDYLVISGMAMGIDTQAHQSVLEHSGITLAVLGSGVLNLYPPENLALANRIMERGAVLCEVQPDAAVSAAGLVARNRIITGLCERVIVVETEVDGGAMHAARFAKLQGRQLYAVANHATGNRALIDDGALALSPDNLTYPD